MDHQEETVSRFLRYIAVDTQSSETTGTHPSTAGQFDLAHILADELKEMGLPVYIDEEHCYVYCVIMGDPDLPRIGFISHMDTSPEASGRDVKPNIVRDYDGGDIALGGGKVLSPSKGSRKELRRFKFNCCTYGRRCFCWCS